MRLTGKLIALLVVLSLFCLVLIGYLAYDNSRQAIETTLLHRLTVTTILKENEFNRWIEDSAYRLRQLAQRPLIQQHAATLTAQSSSKAQWQTAHDHLLKDHFMPHASNQGGFLSLSLLDIHTGLIIVSTQPALEGQQLAHHADFGLSQPPLFVDSGPHFSATNEAQMHMTTPLLNENDDPFALIVGHLDFSEMTTIMQQGSDLSQSEETYLVNEAGFFVTEPRFGKNFVLTKTVASSGVMRCLAGANGVSFYPNYRAALVVGVYRWLPDRKLCLITEIEQAEAFAPVDALRKTIVGVGLIIASLVGIFGVLLARTVTEPVAQLLKGAREFGQGNLDYRIQKTSSDELGELVTAFNAMASQRQAAELAMNHLTAILEATPDIVATIDPEGNFLYLNKAACELLGVSPARFMAGIRLSDVHPEGAVHLILNEGIPAAMRHGFWKGETAFRASDGREFPVSQVILAHRTGAGVVEYLSTIARDIMAYKQLEEALTAARDELELRVEERTAALRESEERYRTLAEAAPDMIFVIDRDDIVRYANSFALKQFGGDHTQVIGLSRAELFPPKIAKKQKLSLDFVFETGQPMTAEDRVQFPDHAAWLHTRLVPLHDESGAVAAVMGVSRDITVRKQMEEELRQKADELARSNAELEQFAYIASHDLQEPLRMVSSYLQLLERRYKEKLDEDATEFINYAVDGALRMKQLINDLLVFSRVGTQGKPFKLTDCNDVMEQVLANLTLVIEEKQATVTYNTLPTVMADQRQLEQLLQNLISNALKFHGQAPPRVHIQATRFGAEWQFSVRDNGIGIKPQFSKQIFVVFQRLHSKNQYPGTGIGLAICKKIVERHGGQIWVESQPDQGSTFFFTLPA